MRERSAAGGIFRVVGRILLILLVTILLFAVFLLGVMGVLIHALRPKQSGFSCCPLMRRAR